MRVWVEGSGIVEIIYIYRDRAEGGGGPSGVQMSSFLKIFFCDTYNEIWDKTNKVEDIIRVISDSSLV